MRQNLVAFGIDSWEFNLTISIERGLRLHLVQLTANPLHHLAAFTAHTQVYEKSNQNSHIHGYLHISSIAG